MDQVYLTFSELLLQMTQVTGSLGISIVILTLIIRSLLLPLTLNSMKSQNEIRKLQPKIKKLKDKHGKDAQAFQKAQMELYKKYNVNPLAGCIPQLAQFGVLILLYQVLIHFFQSELTINTDFLWFNLANSDGTYLLPFLAAASQMFFSLMLMPAGEVDDVVPNDSKSKKIQQENKKEEGMADMAASMQKQMMFIMPVMTFFIALRFPSGLALYWVITTIFSVGQQYFVSGWGGLITYPQRVVALVQQKLIQ